MRLFFQKFTSDTGSLTLKLMLLTFADCLFLFGRILCLGNRGYFFLVWNLFLAWLPYIFSLIFRNCRSQSKILRYLAAALWFIFYPNAPYMLTDFIHISGYPYYGDLVNGYLTFRTDFIMWYDLFLVVLFVLTSILLGYFSLSFLHESVKVRRNGFSGWVFVILISLFSGFAIYLGRFIRLNSWDIVTNPGHLLNTILNYLNLQALRFTVLFGIETFLVYSALYLISQHRTQQQ